MFLAIKDIIHNKLRYSLIITTIFLISYMIFFMTSLAIGLIHDNRSATDNWNSSSVVLSNYSNNNLTASFITENQYKNEINKSNAPMGYMFAVANNKGSNKKINISLFAQNWDSFIAPKLYKGKYPRKSNEIVIDKSLKNYNINMNSKIQLNGSKKYYKVVGLTNDSKFFTVPVIYTSLNNFWTLRYGNSYNKTISAIVSKNKRKINNNKLTKISESKMISNLPGYTPEVNVFMGMIIAMIIITSLVVAIFMYIMILQKTNLYGVMRAQGIQKSTIVWSLICQTFIISLIGILLAIILILITIIFLPKTLFFYPNIYMYLSLGILIIFMSIIGGMISLIKVLKISPLKALGE